MLANNIIAHVNHFLYVILFSHTKPFCEIIINVKSIDTLQGILNITNIFIPHMHVYMYLQKFYKIFLSVLIFFHASFSIFNTHFVSFLFHIFPLLFVFGLIIKQSYHLSPYNIQEKDSCCFFKTDKL